MPPNSETRRGRRQISTVFYLRNELITCSHARYTPVRSRSARWKPTQAPGSSAANCRTPSSVLTENPRERSLLPIPAAAALPLVHRRTTTGRTGPFAQRVRSRPRGMREGNRLRRRCRSRRSGGRQAPSRQTARVHDGRSDPVVITLPKGSYVPSLRSESASLTHGSTSSPTRPPVVGAGSSKRRSSRLQAHEDRHQRTGGRRCSYRAALAWRALAGR